MIVVDSAAVIDALMIVAGTEELRAYLTTEDLHAPSLIDFEIVSALRGLTLRGQLSPTRAQDLLTDFDDLPHPAVAIGGRATTTLFPASRQRVGHDAAYLALAEALDCPLLTRDARLGRSTGHSVRIDVR